MKTLIIFLLLSISSLCLGVEYKYMYATETNKSANAELVCDSGVSVTVDSSEENIIVTFEDRFAIFNIISLESKSQEKIVFNVTSDNKTITKFAIFSDFILFEHKGTNFILIDIPKKYW